MRWYKADRPPEVPTRCRRAARAPGLLWLGQVSAGKQQPCPAGRQLEMPTRLVAAVGREWQIAGGREREIFPTQRKVSLGNGSWRFHGTVLKRWLGNLTPL